MPTLLDMLDPAAEAAMRDQIGGALRTQAVYVAAKLGIADHLALGPRPANELAMAANADTETLRRVLRFLASGGVFTELADGRFALSRAAEYLQSGHPRSLRKSAIRAGEGMWDVSHRLLEAVQGGTTPYELLHHERYFERKRGVDEQLAFAARMSGSSSGLGAAIARQDVFATAHHVVDLGGGHGPVLLAILAAHPHLEGTLFDQPGTIESARPIVEKSAVADRCQLLAGDFFKAVPRGDVYILSWVLHDWRDDDAIQILRNCRSAGGEDAILLIAETLMPPVAAALHPSERATLADPYSMDLQMLLLTGGRERTLDEYQKLLKEAAYELRAVAPGGSARGASLLVAHAALRTDISR